MSTKKEIMEGIEATESKIVANNTIRYTKPDGTEVIRLHKTDILKFTSDGVIEFNSGGWKTPTTKNRMNQFQSSWNIIQDKSIWYLCPKGSYDKHNGIPFFDGIKTKNGKVINPNKSAIKKEKALLKQIQAYCKKVKELPELPLPNNGDCWYCLLKTQEDKSLGDIVGNTDHLKSHLKEKYIHGSLIINALKHAGYLHPEVIFTYDMRDSIVRAIRNYFKSHLGLAR